MALSSTDIHDISQLTSTYER